MRVATIDFRHINFEKADYQTLVEAIEAQHIITTEFKDITEETCPNPDHLPEDPRWEFNHIARPYHGQFTKSVFKCRADAMEDLYHYMRSLTTKDLTEQERKEGSQREIKVLFWDSRLEERLFKQTRLDLAELGGNIELWDLQIWQPFDHRFRQIRPFFPPESWELRRPHRTKAKTVFHSLGIAGIYLHNAANDNVAEVLTLLSFITMTEQEWDTWHTRKEDLPPKAHASWDQMQATFSHNYAQRPTRSRFSEEDLAWAKSDARIARQMERIRRLEEAGETDIIWDDEAVEVDIKTSEWDIGDSWKFYS